MNKKQVIAWAREAGFLVDGDSWIHAGAVLVDGRKSIDEQLKRFAALAAAHEREACAKVCEAQGEYGDEQYAAAIRARGEQS